MKTIAIIGSGTWGCALAVALSQNGHMVKMWSYTASECENINQNRHCKYLDGVTLNQNISAYTDFEETIQDTDYVFHITPSKAFRENLKRYKTFLTNQPVIICSKGIEESTSMTLGEVFEEETGQKHYGILSGPSHAEEVARGIPTTLVIASQQAEIRKEIREILQSDLMKIYESEDTKGVALGGAFKNIIAFSAGIANALQLGDNTVAALITRGLAEIANLGVAMGAQKETFYGLSGLGDVLVTSMSPYSRNRKAGILIGQGKSIEETKQEVGMTIESMDNIRTVYQLAQKHQIRMPIVNCAYDILYNGLAPQKAVLHLMQVPNDKE